MGCGPSASAAAAVVSSGNGNSVSENEFIPSASVPPPIAFVVTLTEAIGGGPELEDVSAPLPPPPPRIQKLLEEPPRELPTPTRIERKLASAERRRTQILQQRAGLTSGKPQADRVAPEGMPSEEPAVEIE